MVSASFEAKCKWCRPALRLNVNGVGCFEAKGKWCRLALRLNVNGVGLL